MSCAAYVKCVSGEALRATADCVTVLPKSGGPSVFQSLPFQSGSWCNVIKGSRKTGGGKTSLSADSYVPCIRSEVLTDVLALMMEAVCFFEMFVSAYEFTRR
jgi:hypothetical protein